MRRKEKHVNILKHTFAILLFYKFLKTNSYEEKNITIYEYAFGFVYKRERTRASLF